MVSGCDEGATVNITVRLTGPLRSLAGCSTVELALPPGATLREALRALGSTSSLAFVERVVQPLSRGEAPGLVLLLNRTRVAGPAELDRSLSPGDIVALVTAMDGG